MKSPENFLQRKEYLSWLAQVITLKYLKHFLYNFINSVLTMQSSIKPSSVHFMSIGVCYKCHSHLPESEDDVFKEADQVAGQNDHDDHSNTMIKTQRGRITSAPTDCKFYFQITLFILGKPSNNLMNRWQGITNVPHTK